MKVFKMTRSLNLVLVPIHLHREDPRIKVADDGSKWIDRDDWSVDFFSFRNLEEAFEKTFDIDLFVDTKNAKLPRFYFRFLCPESLGTDAFARLWLGA